MSKIFVIGYHRTGTRSVNAALQQLGFDIIHYPCPSTEELHLKEFYDGPPWDILEYCDGLSDIVTVPYYQQLRNCYPSSKFILTIRECQKWLASVKRHLQVLQTMRPSLCQERVQFDELAHRLIYGENPTDETRLKSYQRHNAEVITNLGSELLVFDVQTGWEPLCEFLGKDVPPFSFPRVK